MTEEQPAWPQALQDLEGLQRSGQALALLRAAHRAGLSEPLAAGASLEELAGEAVDPGRLALVLKVLASHGVVVESAGTWQLRADWAALVRGESPVAWGPQLDATAVQAQAFLDSLSGSQTYWSLPPADRLVMAQAMSFDPSTPAAIEMMRGMIAGIPGALEMAESGGRFLELGCGIASRLTAMLRAFPRLTAVGVELTEDLAEFGYERAKRLGVADRLEIAVVDAAEYEPEGPFDGAQWSQFFFPERSRIGTLATARMALRPGAWLSAPVIWTDSPPAAGSEEDRDLAHMELLLDLWDVPARTTAEVAAEREAAGFVNVSVDEVPGIHRVRGCQP